MRRLLWVMAAGGALLAWLRPFRVVVAGESMTPALRPGDELVVVRAGRARRGDVVVVRQPGGSLELVKRVAGTPGERVEVADSSWQLGPGEYLVLGDNLAASTDARAFGPVPPSAIAGRVVLRYRPCPGLVR